MLSSLMMRKGKREIKKIESSTSRNVTFTKRRRGLVKKAKELAVLCDASIGLVIFSASGKVFEYASAPGMETIIEKYMQQEKHQNAEMTPEIETDEEEIRKLEEQCQIMDSIYRRLNGKNLEGVSLEGLEDLQLHLEAGLRRLRLREDELISQQISEVHEMGMELVKQNDFLKGQMSKLQMKEGIYGEEARKGNEHGQPSRTFSFFEFFQSQEEMMNSRNSARNSEAEDNDFDTSLQLGHNMCYKDHL